jgi:hypothetical protein
MGKLIVATVATVAAIGASLNMPEAASARSGSVSAGRGFHGAPVAIHRDGGFGDSGTSVGAVVRSSVLHWPRQPLSYGAVRVRRSGWRR